MPSVQESILPTGSRWDEFLGRLIGPGYCDWKEDSWTCYGDLRFTKKLLGDMGVSAAAIEVCLQYYKNHGGYCDCEVVLNVDRSARRSGRRG